MNQKTEEILKKRDADRKRLEYEAKLFQEKQIAEKDQLKKLQEDVKLRDFEKMKAEAEKAAALEV